MKRILTIAFSLIAAMILVSCNKEDPAKATTYTVTMAMTDITPSSSIHYDFTAFEYNEAGERVANNIVDRAVTGTSKTFNASPMAVKVKLYVKMYSDNSAVSSQYFWIQQVFYLVPGGNIEIKLEDETIVGRSEP